jgi:hypothetical protein
MNLWIPPIVAMVKRSLDDIEFAKILFNYPQTSHFGKSVGLFSPESLFIAHLAIKKNAEMKQ